MKCSTCDSYLTEDAIRCDSCGVRTLKGQEDRELQEFDAVLLKLRDSLDNGDLAVDFDYALEHCNQGVQRLVTLIDELRCGVARQRVELSIN
jgi:hypothetical protein